MKSAASNSIKCNVFRPFGMVALAGLSLTLVQYSLLREFAALVGSNELVVLIAIAAYFFGLSTGYLVSDRLDHRTLAAIGAGTLALQVTLPFSARWMVGTLSRFHFDSLTPPFLVLLLIFGLTPFYAVFLPRLIDTGSGEKKSLSLIRLYSVEIIGALAGLGIVVGFTPARMAWILTLQIAALVFLLLLAAGQNWKRYLPLLAVPLLYIWVYPTLDSWSTSYYYRWVQDIPRAGVLASEFSPYQKVDLIEEEKENGAVAVHLFLNGNRLYGSSILHTHNLMAAILPNLIKGRPERTLVVAGGSLDNARYLAPRVGDLTIVEIDETVVRLARKFIQGPRLGEFPTNWDLVIDDGKHYLGGYQGEPFDVIAVDIPVPSFLQTAMLHSERFFALAKSRLAPDGIFSIALGGIIRQAEPDDDLLTSSVSNRIAAGLLKTFRYVTVIEADNNRQFAYASESPFSLNEADLKQRIEQFVSEKDVRNFHKPEIRVIADSAVRRMTAGFQPIGEADMQVVLRLSLSKLYYRFYDNDEE